MELKFQVEIILTAQDVFSVQIEIACHSFIY